MTDSTKSVSPLRQRMIEDMRMRKLSGKTQSAYLRSVVALGEFLQRSPHAATSEDLRSYQLHMVDSGKTANTINANLSGLKFLFEVTLDDPGRLKKSNALTHPVRFQKY